MAAVVIDFASDGGAVIMDRSTFVSGWADERVDTFELQLRIVLRCITEVQIGWYLPYRFPARAVLERMLVTMVVSVTACVASSCPMVRLHRRRRGPSRPC